MSQVERDPELLELHTDFLEESGEGLTQVEVMLAGSPSADDVAAMFRVFHTIKGVAGLLELPQAVKLAHTTETLLDQYRQGKKPLDADWLFEAVAVHREVLAEVRRAVLASEAVGSVAKVEPFVARLAHEIAREPEAPAAPGPGEAEPEAEPEQGKKGKAALKQTLKVDLERIDTLVEMVGELLVTETLVANSPEVVGLESSTVRRSRIASS